jgi:hypothetical protein
LWKNTRQPSHLCNNRCWRVWRCFSVDTDAPMLDCVTVTASVSAAADAVTNLIVLS